MTPEKQEIRILYASEYLQIFMHVLKREPRSLKMPKWYLKTAAGDQCHQNRLKSTFDFPLGSNPSRMLYKICSTF
jgi:hypothetical protein